MRLGRSCWGWWVIHGWDEVGWVMQGWGGSYKGRVGWVMQ